MSKHVYKDKLTRFLEKLDGPKAVPCTEKGNFGRLLYDIYVWQEVADIAKKNLRKAWKTAEDEELIESNEELRKKDEGETIIAESDTLSCVVTVKKGNASFDLDAFISKAASKYKIPKSALQELAKKATKRVQPSVTKRILELRQ